MLGAVSKSSCEASEAENYMKIEEIRPMGKHYNTLQIRSSIQCEFKNVASVFVDGKFVASGYSCQKDSAKIDAAKEAVLKLTETEYGKQTMKGIIASTYTCQKDSTKIDAARDALNKLTENVEVKKLTNGVPLVWNLFGTYAVGFLGGQRFGRFGYLSSDYSSTCESSSYENHEAHKNFDLVDELGSF